MPVLVVFQKNLSQREIQKLKSGASFGVVIAPENLKEKIQTLGREWVSLENLVESGSIYEANVLVEELSRLKSPGGSRLVKESVYKGYELWWIHYNRLLLFSCVPYTQYKRLLGYLKDFRHIYFYRLPYRNLFSCYLRAYGCKMSVIREPGPQSPPFLPFGVLLQIMLTLLYLPVCIFQRKRIMIFTGDKFDKGKDYDFRMKFIYEELRKRKLPFVEFIRGLESWRNVLVHAAKRKRPVIYSDAIVFLGRFASVLSFGRLAARQKFGEHAFNFMTDPEEKFKYFMATTSLLSLYDDIWAIRIMRGILRMVGIRVAFIPAGNERNFHTLLGCKLNVIPTVGILHGATSRHHNVYDFMSGFDGGKTLSVDRYGLWSEWWRAYFEKYSKAYKPEQLYVSGPMRPLMKDDNPQSSHAMPRGAIRVLFLSEGMAVPREVLPYLNELLKNKDLDITIKFRPYRDGFEQWLLQNEPSILEHPHLNIVKGTMQDAIRNIDVTVGCQSTGVLEALLQLRVPIFFRTQKWGDYYDLKEYGKGQAFFAENPKELIEKIKNIRSISKETLKELQERYFGDPYQNGSAWVVDQLVGALGESAFPTFPSGNFTK